MEKLLITAITFRPTSGVSTEALSTARRTLLGDLARTCGDHIGSLSAVMHDDQPKAEDVAGYLALHSFREWYLQAVRGKWGQNVRFSD